MNYLIAFLALTGGNFVYSGYIYDKGLGSECLYDEDCTTRNSFCKGNKLCSCKIGFQYDPGSDVCFPKELGLKCSEDYDCSAIQNSRCSAERCVCKGDYVESKDKNACLPNMRLTGVCEEDSQCNTVMNRSFCDRELRHCICERGLRQDRYRMLCIEEEKKLPDKCFTEKDCELRQENIGKVKCDFVENSLLKRCYCKDGFKEVDGICYSKGSPHAVLSLPAFVILLLGKWLL